MIPNKKKRRKLYQMEIDDTIENGVFAISLVSEPAIEELFVYLSKQPQLIKLAEVDTEKRILVGPVLIPNKEIPRIDDETGEEYSILFTPEVVEKAAQMFLQNQHNNEATIEHTERKVPDVSVVESWIIADPEKDKSNVYGMSYPKGTWMAMMKINNEDVWQNYVKTGKVKGFSLEGMFGHLEVDATWGVEDVPSTSSAQGYPNNTQYPHNINNAPYDVPYSERQLAKLSASVIQFDRAFAKETLEKIKAVLMGKEVEMQSYTDYPDSIKNNAKRGIELNDAVENSCATQVGKIRAQQLANGEPISLETIKRMYSYLSRAETFYDENDTKACGTISYLLWGGLAAKTWSESKLKELGEIKLEGEGGTTTSISSTYSGQFGGPTRKRTRRRQRLADINLAEGQGLEGACWEGYEAIGMKDLDGKMVPNCVPIKLQVEAPELDVFGYPTKNFYICPGAQELFNHLMTMPLEDDDYGMIRSAAQAADNIFAIEKDVLDKEKATPEQLQTAAVLVEDFIDIIHEIDEDTNMIHDTSFMQGHLDTIAKYVA
jgi:hypothetical protein